VKNALAVRLAIHEDHDGLLKRREMQANSSVHPESVLTTGDDSPEAAGDRFTSVPLSRSAIAFLKRSLERNQLRRRAYHAGQLRVWIDGEEGVQFDARVGVYTLFIVPLSASYLEIFGDDDDGALLLAVFPLPEPELVADHQAEPLLVTLEGGQTVAIELALDYGTDGELRAYVIQLAYAESAAVEM
jgi:hypothetical protein